MAFGMCSLEIGSILFLGGFAAAVACALGVVATAILKARSDLVHGRVETIRWNAEFQTIPAEGRLCRHALTGVISGRICERGFDCRDCRFHAAVSSAARESRGSDCSAVSIVESGGVWSRGSAGSLVYGFAMPEDRLYHRGHTWVLPQDDGTALVGLDDFGSRVIGSTNRITLPSEGARLQVNGPGWCLIKDHEEVRILSPIDGVVLAPGGPGDEWYLRVALKDHRRFTHLLRGEEIRPWLLREIERLQGILSGDTLAAGVADGGLPLRDLYQAHPDADWRRVWAEIFFQP